MKIFTIIIKSIDGDMIVETQRHQIKWAYVDAIEQGLFTLDEALELNGLIDQARKHKTLRFETEVTHSSARFKLTLRRRPHYVR
jgi:hypothetical protein